MGKPRLDRSLEKSGFSRVRPSRGGVLWEKGEVRIHTRSVREDPPQYECQTIFSAGSEVLKFVLSGKEGVNLMQSGDWFIVTETAETVHELEQVAYRAANLAGLASGLNAELMEGLTEGVLPLPEATFAEGLIEPAHLELLKNQLQHFRAFQVLSDLPTLSLHIHRLGVRPAFEINPFLLSRNDKTKLSEIMALIPKLLGCLVLINLQILQKDEQAHAACVAFCSRLNMAPEYTGGRIILYHEKDARLKDNPLPFMTLPDLGSRMFKAKLEGAGIQASASNISYMSVRVNNLSSLDQAMEALSRESRLSRENADPHQKTCLVPQFNPRKGFSDVLIHELWKKGDQLLREHLVGHAEIMEVLLQTLIRYFLLGVDRPLVLLFCGASGVGKNFLALIISHIMQQFFQTSEPHYVSFNVSSVVSRWGLQQLTGVQAGLRGMDRMGLFERFASEAGGVLTVDEMDKSGPDGAMQNFLLEVLEQGCFRNGHGELIRFPRSVIVLTMNAGNNELYDKVGTSMGFVNTADPAGEVLSYYRRFTEKNLLPALRGRIDKTFYFKYLTPHELTEIGLRELNRYEHNLTAAGIPWPVKDKKTTIFELVSGLDIRLGARGMVKAVENLMGRFFDNMCSGPEMTGSEYPHPPKP